jgi:hypothetical protein
MKAARLSVPTGGPMESNQRRDNDYNHSRRDDAGDLDREHAQNDGRDKGRKAADDMNRRGMMIDSDVRHQAGTDLHDGSQYDQQGGAAYEPRMGSGEDLQEGARGAAGQDMTSSASRGSGTGETDARYMHQTSNLNSPNNVGDEGFSDTLTPATGGPGAGAIRTDGQGDYSRAETEQTQSDHFREELSSQGEAGANTGTRTQAEHFQEERNTSDDGDDHAVASASADAGHRTEKKERGNLDMTNTNTNLNTNNMRTVAAVFHKWDDATHAVRALQDAGFDDQYVGIARLDSEKGQVQQHTTSGEVKDDGERVAGGIAAGAAVGGVAGLLAALASLAIPGVGPIVAGGMLATTFGSAAGAAITGAGVGAGLGAATGGLIGSLKSLGLSDDEAQAFESDMRNGSTLVTVQAGDRANDAIRMLQQMGGETRSHTTGPSGSNTDPNWRFG